MRVGGSEPIELLLRGGNRDGGEPGADGVDRLRQHTWLFGDGLFSSNSGFDFFGCQVHDLIFAPNDSATAGLASYYVEEALGMWEPRIQVTEVRVSPDPDNNGRMLIHIRYEIKATHDRRSLVFPFYRIPGE